MSPARQHSVKLSKRGKYHFDLNNGLGLFLFLIGALTIAFILTLALGLLNHPRYRLSVWNKTPEADSAGPVVDKSAFSSFKTDLSKSSLDLNKIVAGGPGKDGVPALNEPEFVGASEASLNEGQLGILVASDSGNEARFYPYNLLAWHEIINDSMENLSYAVTFDPLTGASVVMNRQVNGETLTFGVSGLLYESNMIMYDHQTESLWVQSQRKAVAGKYNGTILETVPMQRVFFKEALEAYPTQLKIMSSKTGYVRDYSYDPYADYSVSDFVYPQFKVSVIDRTLPIKEIVYVVPFKEKSLVVQPSTLKEGFNEIQVSEKETLNVFKAGNFLNPEVVVRENSELVSLAGYYEMWFSWALQNKPNGALLTALTSIK